MSSQWYGRRGFRAVILPVLAVISLTAASSVVRAQEDTVLSRRIATITSFTGEVLVRNRMVWKRVEAEGRPLFTGDKVVTKRGRAEVIFVDGSMLRLGGDTNIQITERERVEGLIFRRKWVKRTMRVALGKLYFSLRTVAGKGTVIETPTMVAGIRGTEGLVAVRPDGWTLWGLSEGHAVVEGGYEPLGEIEVPDVSVPAELLPSRDPACVETHIVQSVDWALASQLEADLARFEARQLEQAAAKNEEMATGFRTAENRIVAAELRWAANRAGLQSVLACCRARRDAASEAVVEAETMNDQISAEHARRYLERIDDVRQQAQRAAARVDALGVSVSVSESNAELADASSRLSSAALDVAGSLGVVVNGLARAANMEARGDRSDAGAALQFVELEQRLASRANGLVHEGEAVLLQQAAVEERGPSLLEGGRGGVVVEAIQNTTRAIFNSVKVQDLGTLDGVALELVTSVAQLACQQAYLALESCYSALEAARAGDDAALREALEWTIEAAERTVSIVENVVGEVGDDGVSTAVRVTEALLDVARGQTERLGEAMAEQERRMAEVKELAEEMEARAENAQDLPMSEIIQAAAVLDISIQEAAALIFPLETSDEATEVLSPYAP